MDVIARFEINVRLPKRFTAKQADALVASVGHDVWCLDVHVYGRHNKKKPKDWQEDLLLCGSITVPWDEEALTNNPTCDLYDAIRKVLPNAKLECTWYEEEDAHIHATYGDTVEREPEKDEEE